MVKTGPRTGEEDLYRPEDQMRADGFGKRPKEEAGGEMDEEEEENKRRRISRVEITRRECLVGEWVEEVECQMVEEEEWEEMVQDAWDDVHEGHNLDPEKVKEGRKEELTFMDKRGIWTIRPTQECWDITGAKPVSVRWVDTDKNWMAE